MATTLSITAARVESRNNTDNGDTMVLYGCRGEVVSYDVTTKMLLVRWDWILGVPPEGGSDISNVLVPIFEAEVAVEVGTVVGSIA